MKRYSFFPTLIFLLGSIAAFAQPLADFTYTANCNEITFIDNSSCVGCTPPLTYIWNFGDGATSSTPSPTHTFAIGNGPYAVTLTISDALGANDDFVLQIDTAGCLSVDLSTDTVGCSISLSASSGFSVYQWSTGETTQSIFVTTPGVYQVWVVDALGGIGFADADFSAIDLEGCALISGRVFEDLNSNGIDDGEPGISGVWLRDTASNQVSSYAISHTNGDYSMYVDAFGTHSVAALTVPAEFYCNTIELGQQTLPANFESYLINLLPSTTEAPGNDFGFTYGDPQQCGSISGHVFEDTNQNGVQDGSEIGYFGLNIYIENQGGFVSIAQSDANGDYFIELPIGSYDVSIPAGTNSQMFYCNTSSINTQTFPTNNQGYSVTMSSGSPNSENNDFGLYFTESMDAGIYSLWPDFGIRAGEEFNSGMDWKILGTLNGTCALRVDLPALVTFVDAGFVPTNVGSGFVEWIFTNPTTPIGGCMGMTFYLDSTAQEGELLTWDASFTCTTQEACLNNNTFTRTNEVQEGPAKFQAAPFAPVSKIVIHTGDQETGDVTPNDSTFYYLINFQNTTSDTAFHVRIVDHLSPHLDIKTLSQPFSMSPHKFHVLEDNTIVWEMDAIVLPDSGTSYIDSYSFVQYNIRMKPNLPIGTVIENSAWVFFNREDSVMTNVTRNTIIDPDNVRELDDSKSSLSIYPNPSNGSFLVRFESVEIGDYQLIVTDILGKQLVHESFRHDETTVQNLNLKLSSGSYLLEVQGQGFAEIQKFIVE
mgnify:CR=1 FL=1